MLHPFRLCLYLTVVLFSIGAAAPSIVGAVPSFVPPAAPSFVPPVAHAALVRDFPQGLEIRKELFPGYRKWSTAMGRGWARARAGEARCARELGTPCRLERWSRFLETLGRADPEAQLRAVNRFVNATPFIEDRDNWGAKDYWSAPGEFFARGGDCEDYAISKYLSLRRLGFLAEDLRLVVLIDTRRRLAHAILVVDLDGRSLVLDNLEDRALEWAEVGHYRPLYSLNERAVWLHAAVKGKARIARARTKGP